MKITNAITLTITSSPAFSSVTVKLCLFSGIAVCSNPGCIPKLARLYGGGSKVRLAQEALLGIGGIRALGAMGINVKVCHMNEGHAAFSGLERLAQTMEKYGMDLKTAWQIVPRTTVFTTHTPVAAGHDEFPTEMVMPILRDFAPRLGVGEKNILTWGQPAGAPGDTPMSMFILGLRMAQFCNGVSELHGKVARRMWSFVWPNRSEENIPIGHITNGIHIPTWISPEIAPALRALPRSPRNGTWGRASRS